MKQQTHIPYGTEMGLSSSSVQICPPFRLSKRPIKPPLFWEHNSYDDYDHCYHGEEEIVS